MTIRDVECMQCHHQYPTVQVPRGSELRTMYCGECGCQAWHPSIRARVERNTEAKA
jgi:NAD-dependent SIR2 family protein deacetylase